MTVSISVLNILSTKEPMFRALWLAVPGGEGLACLSLPLGEIRPTIRYRNPRVVEIERRAVQVQELKQQRAEIHNGRHFIEFTQLLFLLQEGCDHGTEDEGTKSSAIGFIQPPLSLGLKQGRFIYELKTPNINNA